MNKLKMMLSLFKNTWIMRFIKVVPVAHRFTLLVLQMSNNVMCWIATIILSLWAAENKRICGAIRIHKKYNKIQYAIIFRLPFYIVNYLKNADNKKYAYKIMNDQIPITLVVLMVNLLLYFSELYGFAKLFRFSAQYIDMLDDYRFMIGFFLDVYIVFSALYIGAYGVKEAIINNVKVLA